MIIVANPTPKPATPTKAISLSPKIKTATPAPNTPPPTEITVLPVLNVFNASLLTQLATFSLKTCLKADLAEMYMIYIHNDTNSWVSKSRL